MGIDPPCHLAPGDNDHCLVKSDEGFRGGGLEMRTECRCKKKGKASSNIRPPPPPDLNLALDPDIGTRMSPPPLPTVWTRGRRLSLAPVRQPPPGGDVRALRRHQAGGNGHIKMIFHLRHEPLPFLPERSIIGLNLECGKVGIRDISKTARFPIGDVYSETTCPPPPPWNINNRNLKRKAWILHTIY